MSQFVFDAGPLITTCKFGVAGRLVIDYILERCEITVAESVYNEVVIAGAHYPDAQAAQQRIDSGQITVRSPSSDPKLELLMSPYGLGDGERDSMLLTSLPDLESATLVMDDHLAYLVCDRLGLRKRFLLDVVADLANEAALDEALAVQLCGSHSNSLSAGFRGAHFAAVAGVNDGACCCFTRSTNQSIRGTSKPRQKRL